MITFDIVKRLGDYRAAQILRLSGTLGRGEVVQLSGPSGSGKTTILKILGGFIAAQEGTIIASGIPWFDTQRHIFVPPHQRGIGFVFQHYALFPHMSVLQHLAYAGRDQNLNRTLLHVFGLDARHRARPAELSGGEQQRLSIIRALASKPRVLLMDEPFSALDSTLRKKICAYLAGTVKNSNITCLISSHRRLEDESDGQLIPNSILSLE